jgi:hypothetical protein
MTSLSETPTNWIEDRNPFNLPQPPSQALKMLWDFDPLLVIVPSRVPPPLGEQPGYLLCRRAVVSAGLGKEAVMENKHPDTWMCVQNNLVPIAPLRWKTKGNRSWTEKDMQGLIAELRSRDTWAVTGGRNGDVDALVDLIEGQEKAAEKKQRRDIRDSFYHRGRDAWRSMQARIGARSKRASDFHGHAVTPGKLVP